MSVKAWKRVITLFVIIIIITLLSTSIILYQKHDKLSETYNSLLDNEYLVDISEYGFLSESEISEFFAYKNKHNVAETLSYQKEYPDLYVENDFIFTDSPDEKVCYLTFDDGPDESNTEKILDTLKKYDVKATFFVVYKDSAEARALYKRIVKEGHTIAVHTASHNYDKIYASVDDYLRDFQRISNHIESITGYKPEIFRFPGGSVNTYNSGIYQQLISEMLRRGYTYYDWNVSSGDTASFNVSKETILDNILQRNDNISKKIILMHESAGHSATVNALPQVIESLEARGYELRALTNDVQPICFAY